MKQLNDFEIEAYSKDKIKQKPIKSVKKDLYFFVYQQDREKLEYIKKYYENNKEDINSYYDFVNSDLVESTSYSKMIKTEVGLKAHISNILKPYSYISLIHPSVYESSDCKEGSISDTKAIIKITCIVNVYKPPEDMELIKKPVEIIDSLENITLKRIRKKLQSLNINEALIADMSDSVIKMGNAMFINKEYSKDLYFDLTGFGLDTINNDEFFLFLVSKEEDTLEYNYRSSELGYNIMYLNGKFYANPEYYEEYLKDCLCG